MIKMGLAYQGARLAINATQNAHRNSAQAASAEPTLGYQPPAPAQLPDKVSPELATVKPRRPQAPAQSSKIDIDAVLSWVHSWLDHYAVWPSQDALTAACLWAAHAACRDSQGTLIFNSTPRLMFLSDEPGSGKSHCLGMLRLLAAAKYGLLTEPTSAAIAHIINDEHETAFIDEADVLFGAGKRKAAIRAILNAGYARDAGSVVHMRGQQVEKLDCFGPVALAGLGSTESATGDSLNPLFDRAIVIRMRKATTRVPSIGDDSKKLCAVFARALWASAVQWRGEILEACDEPMPDWLYGRQEEIWRPLFAIARVAGHTWPDAVEHAAKSFTGSRDAVDTASIMAEIEAQASMLLR
jgi:Protein of unknown function (DUF3631)